MAGEAETIKSFMVGLGFQVDQSSLRQFNDALNKTESNVRRAANSNRRNTTALDGFYKLLRRSASSQRELVDITGRLAKSFDFLGVSLKGLVTIAAGGTIAKSFTDLVNSFSNLFYQAERADTTVKNLSALQFGFRLVGVSAEETTGQIQSFAQAIRDQPGLAEAARQWGANFGTTGNPRDTAASYISALQSLSKIYQQMPGQAKAVAQSWGLTWTQGLQDVLRYKERLNDVIAGIREGIRIQELWGDKFDTFAEKSRKLDQEWIRFTEHLTAAKVEIGLPLLTAARGALEDFEREIIHLKDVFSKSGWSGLGQDLGNTLADQIRKIQWDPIAKALTESGPAQLVDAFMKAILQGLEDKLKTIPGLKWLTTQVPVPPRMQGPPTGAPFDYRQFVTPTPDTMAVTGGIFSGDLARILPDWLRGSGGYRPAVTIDNPQSIAESIFNTDLGGGSRHAGTAGRGRAATHGDPLGAPRLSTGPRFGGAFNVGNIEYAHYGSYNEGIQAVANLLRKYDTQGFHTLRQMVSHYSPPCEKNPTETLIARAARYLNIDPNQPLDVGNAELMRKLVTATILNEYGGRFPRGYSEESIRQALTAAPLGTTNNYRSGDRSVTLNAQTNFHVQGFGDLHPGGAITSAIDRTNADLLRNLSTAIY